MAEYFYGITDTGKRRSRNEDTFFVHETGDKKYIVACVIDGVGGYRGGELAAAIARSIIIRHLKKITSDVKETLLEAIVAANTKIQEQKKQGENEKMACVLTCTVVDIPNNKLWYAHVGDTRIYLLRDASLVKISTDHSAIGFLEETGRLSEEEAMRHPRRNEINKALGFEEDIAVIDDFIETGESPFLPGDTILLCSDGLTDMINSSAITSVLISGNDLSRQARSLIDAANNAGGNDNITAVLIRNNKPLLPKEQSFPPKKKSSDNTDDVQEEEKTLQGKEKRARSKSSKHISTMIFVITSILIAVLAVAFQKKAKPVITKYSPVASIEKDKVLEQLVLKVTDTVKRYALPGSNNLITIPVTITINKDSFYLYGNGTTLMAGDAFKGIAFNILPGAKQIIIDSVVFKNFDVGILVHRNNVVLKNVRFINCRVPMQYDLTLPDTTISGKFIDTIFTKQSKGH